nr:MAG TPA: hypothetical protein [Caudoviricetes sp.]
MSSPTKTRMVSGTLSGPLRTRQRPSPTTPA